MRTSQFEMRYLTVIETPYIPAICVVTGCATLAQTAPMPVILLVAAIAIRGGILELLVEVTLRTGHNCMQTG